jgi:excisionase family DNA binding protein
MSSETYFRPKEAAAYLRSSTSTLAKLRVYGGGPVFCRVGRSIRYRKSDLDEFMAHTCARSTSDIPRASQSKGGQ